MPLSTALAILAAIPVIVFAPEVADLILDIPAAAAPLAILSAYGIARAVGIAVGTALNGTGEARSVTLASALNIVLILALVVPGFRLAGPTGVALVVSVCQLATIGTLAFATRRRGASLVFLVGPVLAVGALVLLVAGPGGPAPILLRAVAGVIGFLLAGSWAWRIVRTRLPGLF